MYYVFKVNYSKLRVPTILHLFRFVLHKYCKNTKQINKRVIKVHFSLTLGQVRTHTFTYDEDSPVITA